MGNFNAKPTNEAESETQMARQGGITIGPPQDVMIHIPRNRVNEHGMLVQQVTRDVDRQALLLALQHVAQYIEHRGKNITVIAVGGAVNTLYLQSRNKTHDVNIYGSTIGKEARILLDEAMFDAQQHYRDLGTDWINTETQMWMTGSLHSRLTEQAKTQNVKIFDMPRLTIYAAPWEYAFSSKMDRILKKGDRVRTYDMEDAIAYIHEYIRNNGGQRVPVATVLDWARQCNLKSNATFLQTRVNEVYFERYGEYAFDA